MRVKRTLRFALCLSAAEREWLAMLAARDGLTDAAALRRILRQAVQNSTPGPSPLVGPLSAGEEGNLSAIAQS